MLRARAPRVRVGESHELEATTAGVAAHFSIVLYCFVMETLKSILKSKKFWTLLSAIVAALAAFFLSSCVAQAKVSRDGIHIDTVRVDYIVRSRAIMQY